LPLEIATHTRQFINATIEAECVQGGNISANANPEMAAFDPHDHAARQPGAPSQIFLAPPTVDPGSRDIGAHPRHDTLDGRGRGAGP
jgi:hypothetical protein